MQLVQRGGMWLLIDETAPPNADVIATVRGPVEVLALRGPCEARLGSAFCMRPLDFTPDSRQYHVTPFADRGNRLPLRIDGSDGSRWRVETEFAVPAD